MSGFRELTSEEVGLVAGGVSLTLGTTSAFSGGIGTASNSSATFTSSAAAATNGGVVSGGLVAGPITLQASPPGS